MTQWLYDFECKHCGHKFDEFLERKEVDEKREKGERITYICPSCGKGADYIPIGSAAHGYHHTSWKV